MIRILIADDHDLMRMGLRSLIEAQPDLDVCGEAVNGEDALEKVMSLRPDIIVLDVSMPGIDGREVARRIRAEAPETQILFFTVHDSGALVQSILEVGASGYILKSDAPAYLVEAIRAISQKNLYFSSGISKFVLARHEAQSDGSQLTNGDIREDNLTPREREITGLLALGKSNKEVAKNLFISVRTVETHRRTIFRKLEINSLAELVLYAIRTKLIKP